jgi:hypothetical protein
MYRDKYSCIKVEYKTKKTHFHLSNRVFKIRILAIFLSNRVLAIYICELVYSMLRNRLRGSKLICMCVCVFDETTTSLDSTTDDFLHPHIVST